MYRPGDLQANHEGFKAASAVSSTTTSVIAFHRVLSEHELFGTPVAAHRGHSPNGAMLFRATLYFRTSCEKPRWRDDLVPSETFVMMSACYRAMDLGQSKVTVETELQCRNVRRRKNPLSFLVLYHRHPHTGHETVCKLRNAALDQSPTPPAGSRTVRGEGVGFGEQPVARARRTLLNTPLGVPLPTALGLHDRPFTRWFSESGERFEIEVPTFSLDSPDGKRGA